MHVRLVMNPVSGKGGHEEEELIRDIVQAGHRVSVLREGDGSTGQGELIAVAGGDGTVTRAVLAFRAARLPLTIIPLGTANNIARSLGINGWPDVLKKNAADKPPPRRAGLAVVRVDWPGGERLLLESVGAGLLARLMRQGPPEETVPERSMRVRRQILGEQVANMAALSREHRPRGYGLRIDGRDCSGDYLLVEIMNVACTGPGLHLAPGKDAGSGDLEVVLVPPNQRDVLENYLAACMQGDEPENLFTRLRGSRVELQCRPGDLHLGDHLPENGEEAVFTVRPDGLVAVLT